MKDEYITVSEFAELAGVSVQAVYKRYSTEFKVINGKKMLKKSALAEFGLNQNLNQVESSLKVDEALLRTVSMLEKELEVKNRQIESLTNLLDQQQKLQAISEAKRLEMKPEKEETSLLNRSKFSTEAEYLQYLCKLVPRIGLFSTRKDREELEKVLELMSEDERRLIYSKKDYREAIEHIRRVDFDQQEQDFKEIEREMEEKRREFEEMRQELIKEQEELRQRMEQRGGI